MDFIKEKKYIALTSVLAAIFLTGFKFIVGYTTNSLGIISEAAHSGLDLIAAIITFFAVSYADKPADKEHPYGHGKLENISAFIETLLLVITCGWIIWEAISRLIYHEHHVDASVWGFVVMGTSIIVDISRAKALSRVAKKYNSQALEADALHFSSDVWSSITVIVGLFFVWLGYPIFDSIAAIMVALLVLFVSYRLGRRTIDALMDKVPHNVFLDIQNIINNVDGVEELKNLRIRASGSHYFVDTIVSLRRTIPFDYSHTIMDNIEKAIKQKYDTADIVIHAEPFEHKDETLIDKIRMLVINKGLRSPHNIEAHLINGKYYIDFDVEYEKGISFNKAHDISTEIEEDIFKQIPSVKKVTIHMEEYESEEHTLDDDTTKEPKLYAKIKKLTEQHQHILAFKHLSLLKDDNDKFNIIIDCYIDKNKSLEEVHSIISELKSKILNKHKIIQRVIIHAEPK